MEKDSDKTEPGESRSLKYLTVQDMLWINLQATKKVHHFRYALLEEATFYQYGYGASHNLALQAGRFLSGFIKLHPFDAGNEVSAFIGCAAFLAMNGHQLDLSDEAAQDWVGQVRTGQVRAEETIPVKQDRQHGHAPTVVNAVGDALGRYPKTSAALAVLAESRVAS